MTATLLFKRADRASRLGEWVFRIVIVLTVLALLAPERFVENFVNPVLIVATIAALVTSLLTQVWQNDGNRLLRATQFTNALGVPMGASPIEGYYNNLLPPSLARLAATTFENTLFTSRVLQNMLVSKRLTAVAYLFVFVILVALRWTPTTWLLVMAQTLFSADVVVHWLRMERFYSRVNRIREQLHQFFVQGGMAGGQNGVAVALTAFTDYECAKEEAATPLDGKIFNSLNPEVTKEWDQLRASLKIP